MTGFSIARIFTDANDTMLFFDISSHTHTHTYTQQALQNHQSVLYHAFFIAQGKLGGNKAAAFSVESPI